MEISIDGGKGQGYASGMSEEKANMGRNGELFPILPSGLPKGIARLAAEAAPTGEGHEPEASTRDTAATPRDRDSIV